MKSWSASFSARARQRRDPPKRGLIATPEGVFEAGSPEYAQALRLYLRRVLFD
jgi:hypothetical protein